LRRPRFCRRVIDGRFLGNGSHRGSWLDLLSSLFVSPLFCVGTGFIVVNLVGADGFAVLPVMIAILLKTLLSSG
jgi:hypothetical protein